MAPGNMQILQNGDFAKLPSTPCSPFRGAANIENADATPPHLDVFVRLGSSGDLLGVLKVICHESLSLFVSP